MKTTISVLLNIVLVIVLGIVVLYQTISDHYYKEFTGFVLRKSAAQIEAGHSELVSQVLRNVKGRPTYGDLIQTLDKLKTKDAEQAVAPNRSSAPALKSTSFVRGPED